MQSGLVQVLARCRAHIAQQARTDSIRTTATWLQRFMGRYSMAKQINAACAHVVEGFPSADHAPRL